MGYLVRRPNTYLYRLALMPFTIYFILRASFGYNFVNEIYNPYNYGQGVSHFPIRTHISRAILWGAYMFTRYYFVIF